MEFKVISEVDNPLFDRKEIEGDIKSDITPSREVVRELLAKKFSVNSDSIKVKTIMGKFGETVFVVVAHIYKSKEEMDKIELKKKKDNTPKLEETSKPQEVAPEAPQSPVVEEKPVEEAPKEEVKEEKPVEEVKQEPVVEEKSEEKPVEENKPEEVKK